MHTEKEVITRRDFLGRFINLGLFVTLSSLILPAIAYILPVTRQGSTGSFSDVGGVDDFPVWGSKKVILGGSGIMVVRTGDGFRAYSAICTHLGCLVSWDDKKREIVCPCHAGIFDFEGRVVSGPPPRPLPTHQVSVVNGRVMVKV